METIEALQTFKNYYKNENYQEALDFLGKNNIFSTDIQLYNLGLLNFKTQNYSKAKLLLEKAKSNGFDSPEVNKLLADSNSSLGIVEAQRSDTFKDNLIHNTQRVNVDLLMVSSLIAILILVINLKRISALFLRITLLIVFILPLAWSVVYKLSYQSYIALEDRQVRAGPSEMFDDSFIMPSGIKYTVSKNYKSWGYITYPDKYSGWVILKSKEQI